MIIAESWNVLILIFFQSICEEQHCLHYILPPTKDTDCRLRTRGHKFVLPRCQFELNKKSFLPRCLYKYVQLIRQRLIVETVLLTYLPPDPHRYFHFRSDLHFMFRSFITLALPRIINNINNATKYAHVKCAYHMFVNL
jgi:hypothetical protein